MKLVITNYVINSLIGIYNRLLSLNPVLLHIALGFFYFKIHVCSLCDKIFLLLEIYRITMYTMERLFG